VVGMLTLSAIHGWQRDINVFGCTAAGTVGQSLTGLAATISGLVAAVLKGVRAARCFTGVCRGVRWQNQPLTRGQRVTVRISRSAAAVNCAVLGFH